jgi:hypothetical protein
MKMDESQRMRRQRTGWLGVLLVGLTGCASVNLDAGFAEVGAAVEERAATRIVELVRSSTTRLPRSFALLGKRFTADDAVQVAMLNNRDLCSLL